MKVRITNPNPVIEVESDWYQYLRVNGKRVYELGNECGTCAFVYEHLQSAQPLISPEKLSQLLQDGIQEVFPELIATVALLLPTSEYLIGLFEITPQMVIPKPWDYWKYLGYGSVKFPYYLGRKYQLDANGYVSEAIVPLFHANTLEPGVWRAYQEQILAGTQPTALAYSIIEGRHTQAGEAYKAPDEWSVMHFLVDGHHKMFAAMQAQAPITLLSFLHYPFVNGGAYNHPHSPSLQEYICAEIYGHR